MSEIVETDQFAREIPADRMRFGLMREILEDHYAPMLFDPLTDPEATERLTDVVGAWKNEFDPPVTSVLTAGVYDLLHLDHTGYLLHTKSTGAQVHFDRYYAEVGNTWETLDPSTQEKMVRQFLSSGELRLIVTVDGDTSVRASKGFNPEKGGGERPIFSWDTRVRMIANLMQPCHTPDRLPAFRPVVDAITMHGPHDFDEDSPHHRPVQLATALQPDVWAIYGEAQDTLRDASMCEAIGEVALKCIPLLEGTTYFEDKFVGKFSTTKIIQRARG